MKYNCIFQLRFDNAISGLLQSPKNATQRKGICELTQIFLIVFKCFLLLFKINHIRFWINLIKKKQFTN